MFKISQSFIKAYTDYKMGKECGVFFKARYIDKDPDTQTPPTDAMKAGIYFEYLCTGALPKSGIVPEPEISYKGQAREKISEPYMRAIESSKVFKRIIKSFGITIKSVGTYLEANINGIIINGITDIIAEWHGQDVIIDLKYSGLINDKWNEMGWDIDSLPQKQSLMVQGVHYQLLGDYALGKPNMPFYFFVFSSTDPNDVKIINEEVDATRVQNHVVSLHNIHEYVTNDLKNGFTPTPSLSKCSKCPIAHKCQHKTDLPKSETVTF